MKNAPAIFQRFIEDVLRDVPNQIAYIDDIFLFSNIVDEHVKHLTAVVDRLNKWGLMCSPEKCHLFQQSVNFVGITFTPNGYRPSADYMPKVLDMKPPTKPQGVLKFMGMLNYFKSHIPDLAGLAAPLYDLTKQTTPWKWTAVHDQAF